MEPGAALGIYLGATLLSLLLAAYIFALVFGVKQHKWYQQKQLDITIAMAKQAGVPQEELNEIIARPV